MRTTLNIDDSILEAARELARRQGKTTGEIISALARQALTQGSGPPNSSVEEPDAAYGFKPLPAGDELVTNEVVDKLRDEQGV